MCRLLLKGAGMDADNTRIMIISDEQVRRAAEYLRCIGARPCQGRARPSSDDHVIPRAVAAALSAPDVRADRVAQAQYITEGYLPDSEAVAEKLLGRLISDSLR
ncbi:MAG: flagellar biosynthesis anti-sigma factor FlgM [Coriobacteriia bacterium]|nr:flagellar biosynthesis anti-sigma factor FlgM [Coriobacteriia bacterium]